MAASKRRRLELCPCLDLTALHPPQTHHRACPVLVIQNRVQPPHCWFDWQARLQDPLVLHTHRPSQLGISGVVAPPVTRDLLAARRARIMGSMVSTSSTAASSLLQQGYGRIDRFVKLINYARAEIEDCQKVYQVTDDLVRHYFAQCK